MINIKQIILKVQFLTLPQYLVVDEIFCLTEINYKPK